MKNLEGIKVGDKVYCGGGFNSGSIVKVKRITKTLIITEGGSRYKKI